MSVALCLDLPQEYDKNNRSGRTSRRAVDRFIRRENVRHFRELLKAAKDEAERQRILKLLAEEQQKQKDAGDKIDE